MWIPLPREINDWWRNRNDMRLVSKDGVWQVEGPEAHRARVAYASLEGDRVVYNFDSQFHPHQVPTLAGSQASPRA
jgi:hypothetical protein